MVKACAMFIIFIATGAFMLSPAHATVEFSASLVVSPKAGAPLSGKIFVKGPKVRQEIPGPNGDQIMIFRPDRGVAWMKAGPGKMWLQMPYLPSDNPLGEWTSLKAAKARLLGKLTVCGMNCAKYLIVEDGRNTVYWISTQLSYPIKIENQNETIELKNLKKCRLDNSLFKIPAADGKAITTIAPPQE